MSLGPRASMPPLREARNRASWRRCGREFEVALGDCRVKRLGYGAMQLAGLRPKIVTR